MFFVKLLYNVIDEIIIFYVKQIYFKYFKGEKLFACTKRDNAFSIGTNTKGHVSIHTREKAMLNLNWNIFIQLFLVISNGIISIYIKENPFKCYKYEIYFACAKCDYAFSKGTIVVYHLMIHTGETVISNVNISVIIHYCNSVINENMIHTGEKPLLYLIEPGTQCATIIHINV